MARAIDWASNRKQNNGGQFLVVNAGSNQWNYQVRELAEKVKDIIGNVEIKINPDAVVDKRSYRVDFSLFNELAPDYIPKITLDEAVNEILIGLRSNNFTNINFRQSHYIRLKTLTNLIELDLINDNLKWNKNLKNDI